MQKNMTDTSTILALALICLYIGMKLTISVLIVDKNICDSLQNDLIFGEAPSSFVNDNGQIPTALCVAITIKMVIPFQLMH